jgi:DNA (cytosine-5)-methyltransferase 1
MKFMDFCSGIGGGRLGLEENNIECMAHSEIDMTTDYTYRLFFGAKEQNYGDLMHINTCDLPNFDILIGGFPCQTFSIVGKREGFQDKRGQIIYGLIKIMSEKNVPYFILENVKGLVNHNKGETLNVILNALTDAGYYVDYKVLNSLDYGVPQIRERVYFIGIKKELHKIPFKWPIPVKTPDIKEYLIDTDNEILDFENPTWQKYINNKYNKSRFDFSKILKEDYLVLDWRQSDLRVYRGKTPTLRTGRHGILYVKNGKLRKLSGYEGLLLQGFPKHLAEKSKQANINNNKLLSQAGNAMTVSVISALGKALKECAEV